VPRLISGHRRGECDHILFAQFQICDVAPSLQWIKSLGLRRKSARLLRAGVTSVGCGYGSGWDSDGCDRGCRGFVDMYYGIVGRVRCLSQLSFTLWLVLLTASDRPFFLITGGFIFYFTFSSIM
jgi:hypothetical protein